MGAMVVGKMSSTRAADIPLSWELSSNAMPIPNQNWMNVPPKEIISVLRSASRNGVTVKTD
jgi:hypothetical protein